MPEQPDRRPHSRACGITAHPHGPDCHANCPTCGVGVTPDGRTVPEPMPEPTASALGFEICGESFYGYLPKGAITGMDWSIPRMCTLPTGHKGSHLHDRDIWRAWVDEHPYDLAEDGDDA